MRLQFLESYKSVELEAVAAAFGVSANFMDAELADFIVAGRLSAKIDKVAGVVETNRRALSPPIPACPMFRFCTRVYVFVLRGAREIHSIIMDLDAGEPRYLE